MNILSGRKKSIEKTKEMVYNTTYKDRAKAILDIKPYLS
jgi:hypothetical protein